jgi:hypothetical protein
MFGTNAEAGIVTWDFVFLIALRGVVVLGGTSQADSQMRAQGK